MLLDAEVTAEVNPDSITKADLVRMRRAGFNRISVGLQSANDALLKNLGRRHTFAKAEETVKNARDAGFANINVDLIYGLPSQTRDDWADTLNRAASLKPEHISCYGLKIEEGSQLYIYKDSPFLPDEDAQADMYLYAVETLSRFGYKQYEISNFARRGYESRHNMKYWFGDEYLGFGAAAHSYIGGVRYNYIADLEKYSENVLAGKSILDLREEITDFEKASEYLMLRLRDDERHIRKGVLRHLSLQYGQNGKPAALLRGAGLGGVRGRPLELYAAGISAFQQADWGNPGNADEQRTEMTRPWDKREEASRRSQLTLFEGRPQDVQLFRGI